MNAADLQRKVGPLPVWAWVGSVGAGLFLLWRRQHHPAAAGGDPNAAAAADALTYPGAGIDPATGTPYSQEIGAALGAIGAGGLGGGAIPPSAPDPLNPTGGLGAELGDLSSIVGLFQQLGLSAPGPGAPQEPTGHSGKTKGKAKKPAHKVTPKPAHKPAAHKPAKGRQRGSGAHTPPIVAKGGHSRSRGPQGHAPHEHTTVAAPTHHAPAHPSTRAKPTNQPKPRATPKHTGPAPHAHANGGAPAPAPAHSAPRPAPAPKPKAKPPAKKGKRR